MALSSAFVVGSLGLAGLSLSASLALLVVAPGADAKGESQAQNLSRELGNAGDDKVPAFHAPDPMTTPVPVHGSWQLLFQARTN